MPSPVLNMSQLFKAIQYTGSNSADIDSQVPGVSITSETGGILTLDFGGNPLVLNTNDWIYFNAFQTFAQPNSQHNSEWNCVTVCADAETFAEELGDVADSLSLLSTAVTGAFVRAMGMAPVPTLLLGQDTTVNVQLQPAMPDSGYSAYAVTFGGVDLESLSITSVSVVDTDTVAVAVDNVGLNTISGVTVAVHAID